MTTAVPGDPESDFGEGASSWGIWRVDPGPRGVYLKDWPKLAAQGGVAPHKWYEHTSLRYLGATALWACEKRNVHV